MNARNEITIGWLNDSRQTAHVYEWSQLCWTENWIFLLRYSQQMFCIQPNWYCVLSSIVQFMRLQHLLVKLRRKDTNVHPLRHWCHSALSIIISSFHHSEMMIYMSNASRSLFTNEIQLWPTYNPYPVLPSCRGFMFHQRQWFTRRTVCTGNYAAGCGWLGTNNNNRWLMHSDFHIESRYIDVRSAQKFDQDRWNQIDFLSDSGGIKFEIDWRAE
jgi:hypothetical protein